MSRIGRATARWLRAWINVYFFGLFAWLALWLVAREHIAAVELLTSLAIWFFLPVPAIAVAGVGLKGRGLWVATALAAAAFVWLWGGLFLPRGAAASGPVLTVMTYNALGPQSAVEAAIEVIQVEQADVVAIQEVNPELAQALASQFSRQYPYQILDPQEDVFGMGVISRYPLAANGERLPLNWIGVPQVVELDWAGRRVTLVNFHAWPPQMGTVEQLGFVLAAQAQQGSAIATYARQAGERGPVIALGDANVTDLNLAYRSIAGWLQDSWREVGFGFGHTWGGSKLPQTPFGPIWAARIDYVFHSPDLAAVEARLGKFDGVSDHRGVVVKLAAR